MPNKMQRFSQEARRVLSMAQEEAERLQHSMIGPEHLLLGLLRADEQSAVVGVLHELGLNVENVLEALDDMGIQTKTTQGRPLDLSTGVKRALELAVDEARRLRDSDIRADHLLLGLLRLDDNRLLKIFERNDLNPEQIREAVNVVMPQTTPRSAQLNMVTAILAGLRQSAPPDVPEDRHLRIVLTNPASRDEVAILRTPVSQVLNSMIGLLEALDEQRTGKVLEVDEGDLHIDIFIDEDGGEQNDGEE